MVTVVPNPKSHIPLMPTSPNMEGKSRLLSHKEPINVEFYIILYPYLDYFMPNISRLVLWVGRSVLLNSRPKFEDKWCRASHLQKVMPCRRPCCTWNLCEMVSLNFPSFFSFFFKEEGGDIYNRCLTTWLVFYLVERRFHGRESNPQPLRSIWVSSNNLGSSQAKSQLPCSQWLRLHGLTSNELGL